MQKTTKRKFMKIFNMLYSIFLVSPIFAITPYLSQVGQDKFVNEIFFKNKTHGVFIDIGAHDGKTGSNTYFFEKELQWNGICFEPLPHLFEKLQQERMSVCINSCVSAVQGEVAFLHVDSIDEMLSGMICTYDPRQLNIVLNDISHYGGACKTLMLPSVTLSSVLDEHQIFHIDFLSIDTEGSELSILKTIDFKKYTIDVITIENNYGNPEIKEHLERNGYIFIKSIWPDEIYASNDFLYSKK